MKKCVKCQKKKERLDFCTSKKARDGLQSWCKKCVNIARMKTYWQDPKAQHLRSKELAKHRQYEMLCYLSVHPCVDCGEDDLIVLEFDHVRGNKSGNVSELARKGCSSKKLQKEIAKCEIRCCNCHRRKTLSRLEKSYRVWPMENPSLPAVFVGTRGSYKPSSMGSTP